MEEILEMVTWSQLRIHTKPVILLNINDFYTPLRTFISGSVQSGFIKPANEALLVFLSGPQDVQERATWDWGKASVKALRDWQNSSKGDAYQLNWDLKRAQ